MRGLVIYKLHLNPMIQRFTDEEKGIILKNAESSFVHGVEHLCKYQEERNIKFAILHIFNTVELLVKAYLGWTNKALLQRDIDKDRREEKNWPISVCY